jgi:hypothetical protein
MIQQGDLVNLYRRVGSGVGIVLEQIDDTSKVLKIPDGRQFTANVRDMHWNTRTKVIAEVVELTDKPRLGSMFFYYNSQWCKKYKNSFSFVRWFKSPSAYGAIETQKDGWYPTEWLKTIKKST